MIAARRTFLAGSGQAGYMFPRPDGTLLGGTFERGEESAEPDPADIARIIASHQQFFAGWRCG
jgi:D-amino-acid oxidase